MFSDFLSVDLSIGDKSQGRLDVVLEEGISTQIDIMLEQGMPTPDSHDALNDSILESKSIEEDDEHVPDFFDSKRDYSSGQSGTNNIPYDDTFVSFDGECRDSTIEHQLGQTLQSGNIKKWVTRLVARRCMQLAKKGNASSQYHLGCMYAKGSGVEQNYLMAYVWCKISALQHLPKASLKLEEIEPNLTDEHIYYATNLSKRYYDNFVAPFRA